MVEKNPAVLARLKAPAICLVAVAILGIAVYVASPFMGQALGKGALGWFQQLAEQQDPDYDPTEFEEAQAELDEVSFGAGTVIQMVLGVGLCILTLFGAMQMMKAESWGLALTAAILAITCANPCCIGLPFGIWALVVLFNPDVKQAFQA